MLRHLRRQASILCGLRVWQPGGLVLQPHRVAVQRPCKHLLREMPKIPHQQTKYQHRPIGHYRPICRSVCLCLLVASPGEEEKGQSGKDLKKRKINVNFLLNVNFPAIPVKQFLCNQQSYPDIIYRHLQSSLLLVDEPLYIITGWLIDWSF